MKSRLVLAIITTAASAIAVVAFAMAQPPARASAERPSGLAGPAGWIGAWGASMTAGGPSFHHQTIRETIRSSIGGDSLRVHLTNWPGRAALTFGEVDLAVSNGGADTRRGTSHDVTFAGARSVVVPVGGDVTSDVVDMRVTAGEDLVLSVYVPGTIRSAPVHSDAFATTYVSRSGNYSRAAGSSHYGTKTSSWYFVDGLDVRSSQARATVVAFGDSITDGTGSTPGDYRRWTDDLARSFAGRVGVVDAGIAGNRVLTYTGYAERGLPAETRFAHDALGVTGVREVVLLEGINDIGPLAGPDGTTLTAQDLIDGYEDLIAEAHAAHVRVIGVTILPYQGARYYRGSAEAVRETVNRWIRTSGAFDGVIDADAAMRSARRPLALNPAYDCGDHVHPSDAGHRAIAAAAYRVLSKLA
jgi:lysophospholipase L1-like esterase